ncbi:MAG: VWA domain-containing protein [Deltaproteobacteria bacterium]|nr:VWA domain-containing protein [Deltaproteobacteria bacterium]
MKENKIKKTILGAVFTACILSLGMGGSRVPVVCAATASKVSSPAGEVPQAELEQAELDIVFVLDNSGSMRNNDPNFITKEVVTNFLGGLGERSRLGMVIFDETANLVEPLTSLDNAEVRARFLESLDVINFKGKFTNSPAGIERAIYELKTNGRQDTKKIIVFLTDGIVDTGNKSQDLEKENWLKEDLTRESKNAGIRIFGIAFTDNADFRLIQTLAVRTDGEYFRVFEVADLQEVFTKIKRIIAEPSAQETLVSTAETNRVTPLERKEASVKQRYVVPEMPRKQKSSLVLILSGIVVLLALIVLLQVVRKRKTNVAQPAMDQRTGAKILPAEPRLPQAVLIDVGKAISTESLTLPLNKDTLRIGRDIGNDVVIARKTISSFHATIEYKDGYFYLEDLRSTNGTRLNDGKLSHNEPVRLKSGDKIDFSIHEFRFLIPDQTPLGETVMVAKMS